MDMKVVAGLDIGNGYTKGKLVMDGKPYFVDMPSVAKVQDSNIPKEPNDSRLKDLSKKVWFELDSTLVGKEKSGVRPSMHVGDTASKIAQTDAMQFHTDSSIAKCEEDLSSYLITASLASCALEHYWNLHGTLPEEDIDLDAYVGLALPVTDYRDHRHQYQEKLKGASTTVIIKNFEQEVKVNIHFREISVNAEGAACYDAIQFLGKDFVRAMIRQEKEINQGLNETDVLGWRNLIIIDLGAGTTNLAVIDDGEFFFQNSSAVEKGINSVLTKILDARIKGAPSGSVANVARYYVDHKAKGDKKETVENISEVIQQNRSNLLNSIQDAFKDILSKSPDTQAVYVVGGGAEVIKNELVDMIHEVAEEETTDKIPVLYLSSQYSRKLNQEGLYANIKNLMKRSSDPKSRELYKSLFEG